MNAVMFCRFCGHRAHESGVCHAPLPIVVRDCGCEIVGIENELADGIRSLLSEECLGVDATRGPDGSVILRIDRRAIRAGAEALAKYDTGAA